MIQSSFILSVAEKAVAEVNVAELNGTETKEFNELNNKMTFFNKCHFLLHFMKQT